MSLGADAILECIFNELERDLDRERTIAESIEYGEWLTNDGRFLKIHEMSSEHIRNARKMLLDGRGYDERMRDRFVPLFDAELAKRYPPIDPSDERYDF